MTARSMLLNVQGLRGLAALMVLLAHLSGAERYYIEGPWLLPAQFDLAMLGVDLFFVISGFVMAHVTMAGPRGARAGLRFALDRAGRIYPLYWLATLGFLALIGAKALAFGEGFPLGNLVASFLLLPQESLPLLSVGWTLTHELYFYLVMTAFVAWIRAPLIVVLLVWTGVTVAGRILGPASPAATLVFSMLTMEFIAGALVGLAVRQGMKRFAAPSLCLGLAGLLIVPALFYDALWPSALANHDLRAGLFTLPAALVVYGAAALEGRGRKLDPAKPLHRALLALGDASYSLYLCHLPIVLTIGALVQRIGPAGVAGNLLLILGGSALAITVSLAVHKRIEKPLLTLTKSAASRLAAAA